MITPTDEAMGDAVVDKMSAPAEPDADDEGGDAAAQESAAEDFAAAVKAGKGAAIVAAFKELRDLIGE